MNFSERSSCVLWLFAASTAHLGCTAAGESTPKRAETQSGPVAMRAGAPAPAADGATASSTLIAPPVPAGSGSKSHDTQACQPGVYVGTYMAELFGGGPLRFDLVAAMMQPKAATPCQEFCPELEVNSDGGEFRVTWAVFDGVGKVRGGLDCRSGEFRGELVEGKTGISPLDAGTDALGTISGTFQGRFSASPKPAIDGTFMTLADGLVEASGTFRIELQP